MKNYEKPMALIEKINVEDVITASILDLKSNAELKEALVNGGAIGADDNVIIFEW
jgi:hypothetical protein